MSILDRARRTLAALTGRTPALIPREQVQVYIEICRTVIAHMATRLPEEGGLFPIEGDFVVSVTELCENCVFAYNAAVLEDTETMYGAQKLIDKFWRAWDKSFGTIAIKRNIKEDVAMAWQAQLYALALFAKIEHFHGVRDSRFAPQTDASRVYQREAQVFDLRSVLEGVIKQEGITAINLPAISKAA